MDTPSNLVFNFAASYSGGGHKRLFEFARWFDQRGGANFIVHPRCADLSVTFARNRYFIAAQSRWQRLYDDCGYLRDIERQIGTPDLYYSYGIPLYFRFGTVSWFHLSNVLPLDARGIPLPLYSRLTLAVLGKRIRRGFANADVISAESKTSTDLIAAADPNLLFVSVNGSDDEIATLRNGRRNDTENIATVVGTIRYKALAESVRVFEMLKRENPGLKLMIIGNATWVPNALRTLPDVVICGALPRSEVIGCLRKSKFYITTSRVENSFNAAAEGIFLADESYISDIGPHRELLLGMPFDQVSVPGATLPSLHVRRDSLTGDNLKSWDTVIREMLARFRSVLQR
jgi:glycosyltransferase involved in cell wall biosynthesis